MPWSGSVTTVLDVHLPYARIKKRPETILQTRTLLELEIDRKMKVSVQSGKITGVSIENVNTLRLIGMKRNFAKHTDIKNQCVSKMHISESFASLAISLCP